MPEQREWRVTDADISNFDRIVPDGLADELRSGECYCDYAAWNFHAKVWFEDGAFKARVSQYHQHVATIEASSLEELMTKCSDEYGYD